MDRFEQLPDRGIPVTPELKQRISDLNREANALHIGCLPTVYVRTRVTSECGKVLSDRECKANSFNRNFYNFMVGTMYGAGVTDYTTFGEGHINAKKTDAGLNGPDSNNEVYGLGGTSGYNGITIAYNSVSYGIFCGTGTDAESFDGYALSSIVHNGISSGQMTYMAPVKESATYNLETKKWTIVFSRIAKNTSGATIIITETGLYTRLGSSGAHMIERTLLPSSDEVPNGSQDEIFYTFEMTMPEPA